MKKSLKTKFLFLILIANQLNFSESATTCSKSSKQINSCIKDLFNDVKPLLVDAVPQWNTEALDPLNLARVPINDAFGPIDFKGNLENVTIKGLGSYQVTQAKSDLKSYRLDVKTFIPKLEFHGLSKTRGTLGALIPFSFDGILHAWIDNMNTIFKVQLQRKMKNGVPHLQLAKFDLAIGIKNIRYKVDDPTSATTGQFLTGVMNAAPFLVFDAIKGTFSRLFQKIFYDKFKVMFESLPESHFFVD